MRFQYLVLSALLGLAAPGEARTADVVPPATDISLNGGGYRLDAGDRLRITVYNEPTLTGVYAVTAAGAVAFPLIGDVPVRGRTIELVQADLRHMLASYVNDPRVSVEPVDYRPYYILGEVNKPGRYVFEVGLKVEQAVAAAGGYTYRANRGTAFVKRSSDGAERRVKIRKQTVPVLPGDTIRIGERYF